MIISLSLLMFPQFLFGAVVVAQCQPALDRALRDAKIRTILGESEYYCKKRFPMGPGKEDDGVPKISCCECKKNPGGDECANYDPVTHSICLCKKPDGSLICDPNKTGGVSVEQNLWEEIFHSVQECLGSINYCPYHTPPYKGDDIKYKKKTTGLLGEIDMPCGQSEYSGAFLGWCRENNEECQNPFGHRPASKPPTEKEIEKYAESFCKMYSPKPVPMRRGNDDDEKALKRHNCCIAFVIKNFKVCCDEWIPQIIPADKKKECDPTKKPDVHR